MGDSGNLGRLITSLRELGRTGSHVQDDMARGVVKEVRGVLDAQFASGVGPDGPWQETVRGKPALVSKKLAGDFWGQPYPGGAQFGSRVPWLKAHHTGHVFASRGVGANARYLTFNRGGRLISNRRALDKNGRARRGVSQTFARAHTVGARVLPRRPVYPTGGMPAKWAQAISEGVRPGLVRWRERSAK